MKSTLQDGHDEPADKHTPEIIKKEGDDVQTSAQSAGIKSQPEQDASVVYPFRLPVALHHPFMSYHPLS